MGTRVWACVEIGPWDEAALKGTEPGRALLDAIEAENFEDREIVEVDGITTIRLQDGQVNYGTAHFADIGLHTLAAEAGLWWEWETEGSCTWGPSHEVGSPGGDRWSFEGPSGQVQITASEVKLLKEKVGGDPAELVAGIEEHFALGNRSLAAWIKEAAA